MIYAISQLANFSPRIVLGRTPQAIRIESDLAHPLYNRVVTYQGALSGNALDELGKLADDYRARKVPFTWLTWPQDDDVADLEQALEAIGLIKVEDMSGMSLSLTDWTYVAPAIPGFVIKQIRAPSEMKWFKDIPSVFGLDGEAGDVFVQICEAAAFGENAVFRHYVGFLDGKPAAAVTAIQDGETIGIYNVATLEAYRRRGLGSAMTAHAVREGQAAGGRIAVLQASKMGNGVYQSIGFSDDIAIGVYLG
ncbi:GNAT family N-acetyltransferase [Cohnella lupini]|nr:GNAT family N-acetyltransferase [Cohnella lupini]